MRILVIGGTRFMGPLVVHSLSDAGHEVVVFHRGQNTIDLPQGVQEILGDRHSLASHTEQFRRFEPEVVLDMIPFTEQDAQEVMSTFQGIAGRVVAISSQDVYRAFGRVNNKESGPVEPGPITEDSPLREHLYPYRGQTPRNEDQKLWMNDYDKILVERVVMGNAELPGTILRLPAVYGPGDYQHRMFVWLKRMDDERPAILLDEKEAQWRWAHGYVENVAIAIVLAVTDDRASGRIYNVGDPFTMSMADRIRKIGEATGWHGNIVLVSHGTLPQPLSWGINAEQDIVVDTKRIREELGYQERINLDAALKRTIDWERANPPAQIDPSDFDYAAEDTILEKFQNAKS